MMLELAPVAVLLLPGRVPMQQHALVVVSPALPPPAKHYRLKYVHESSCIVIAQPEHSQRFIACWGILEWCFRMPVS